MLDSSRHSLVLPFIEAAAWVSCAKSPVPVATLTGTVLYRGISRVRARDRRPEIAVLTSVVLHRDSRFPDVRMSDHAVAAFASAVLYGGSMLSRSMDKGQRPVVEFVGPLDRGTLVVTPDRAVSPDRGACQRRPLWRLQPADPRAKRWCRVAAPVSAAFIEARSVPR